MSSQPITFNSKSAHQEFGCFGSFQDGIACVAAVVMVGAKKAFSYLAELQLEPNSFGRILKLGENLLTTIELGMGKENYFSSITASFEKTRGIIDLMQIFDGIGYFIGERVEEDSWFGVVGNGVMFAGTLGSIVSFLDELSVIDLGAIASSLGSIPVLGVIFRIGITFEQVVTSVVTIGFACFSADAIDKLVDKEESPLQKRQAWIDLAWNIAEIAAAIFFICAATQIIGVIVLGTIASSLGLVAFLHRIWVQKQEEKQSKQQMEVGDTQWLPT